MDSSDSWSYPAPSYRSLLTYSGTELDSPGRRCGHTLSSVIVENSHQLVLFGGTIVAETGASPAPGAILQGATNSVHVFDFSTRRWTRIYPRGEAPSPRAGHAATSLGGSLVAIQGGIGPSGICPGDLYLLDTSSTNLMWYRVVAQEDRTPGPRYGHVMALVGPRLIVFGGGNGNQVYSDTWALDTTQRPFAWDLLYPFSHLPSARIYASASARDDGIFVICGGRDHAGRSLGDTYELKRDCYGQWIWTLLPHVTSPQRYQHTSVFVGPRFHVIGGVQTQHGLVDGDATATVLNTVTGHWLGRNLPMASTSNNNFGHYQNLLMRRCRHAIASIGNHIYIHGGLRDGTLLSDFLVAEDFYLQQPSSSSQPPRSSTESSLNEASIDEGYAGLRRRTVPIPRESFGNWGGLVLQRSLVQSENQSRRPPPSQIPQVTNIVINTRESTKELRKKVFSTLLKPKDWKPPTSREFFLSYNEIAELCDVAELTIMKEPTVLQLKAPIKVFGDLHGQFGDLMRLFKEFGCPSIQGDITYIDYLFLGDYVDRGQHSLETIMLLLTLKIEYPDNIHLIRGNHESDDMNTIYGFLKECKERIMGEFGLDAYNRINRLFTFLPLAALIGKKIFCVHGGIGDTVLTVEQVMNIQRPIFMDSATDVIRDLLWSDPTVDDSVLGITNSTRGPAVVAFGPDIVEQFCEMNNIELILRGHECVLDGFERFAGGKLITVFSATNYCGNSRNAGAILVIGKDLLIVAKMIHPRPPSLESSEDPPPEDSWMVELNDEMPPTPPRGSKLEEGSSSSGVREVTIDDLVGQEMEEFAFASSTNDDDKRD